MTWWSSIIVALIYAGPPSALAWLAWRQSRASHIALNSRLTELLEVTRKSSRAEGKAEGVAEQKASKEAIDPGP